MSAHDEHDDGDKQQHMSHLSLSICHSELKESVRGRSQLEVHLLLRAVSFVAVSFRLLHELELYAAVVSNTAQSLVDTSASDSRVLPSSSNDLLRLCSHVLRRREDGSVEFSRTLMRRFLLTSEVLDVHSCHETMTRTCLQYIQQTESQTILRPSKNFWGHLTGIRSNPFLNYARRYWPKHYKLAESENNDLPTQLHDTIEVAIIADHPKEDGYLNIEIRRLTLDACLQLSLLYGFTFLENLSRRAGAELTFQISVFGTVSERYTPLCGQHSTASSEESNIRLNTEVSFESRQVTQSVAEAYSVGSFRHILPPEADRPLTTSDEEWVLVHADGPEAYRTGVAKRGGLCVKCLASDLQHLVLVQQPAESPDTEIKPSLHVTATNTRGSSAQQRPHPSCSVARSETLSGEYVFQQLQSPPDWYIVDGRNL